jgi:thiamine biosynthesis lipoprotein
MKKIICIILLISVSLSLCSCRDTEDKKEFKARSREISSSAFNTSSWVYTYGDEDDTNVEKWADIAGEILEYYHKLFDIYYEYSGVNNVRTINKNAGKNPVEVDTALVDFLIYCKEMYTKTEGNTNVMLGSVLKIWHDAREEADSGIGYLEPEKLPGKDVLERAGEHVSIDSLVINKEASTVYISDPEASLDVGAIAKGYAVDIIYERLVSEGADSVILNVGGNVRTIGLRPDGSKWATGITNPDRSSMETVICRMEVGEISIVTSGDYERYFVSSDNRKYHHIIDPETLEPARYFSSVTILSDNSGVADALSTALFCMSYEEGKRLLEGFEGVEVIWIDTEYNVKHTDGVSFIE